MLSEALSLELEGLSTLQRKLLIELLQRRYPQFWSSFTDHKNSCNAGKKLLKSSCKITKLNSLKNLLKPASA
jgi:hypothetical protein